ncbi:glycosyltransferase [Ferruginibacter sp.]|uniref:glycosyltransferase n=1 Tax=Ferruginibacter sp. TaxID=1940288 RepID=UPI0019C7C78B|nr:glycosyltransferase [Ferruginibacter sp.]MBC7626250.1 glycosyltransferase [Ferruginibacter sp.]
MRILFVSETYYPHLNGVYYFVCRLAPLLQANGHQVAVIAPSENTHFSKKKIDNIDVYVVPSLPLLYYPKLRFPIPVLLQHRIKGLIDSFKPDVIHIQDHFILSKAVVEVNKKLKIPIIGTNHFMPENLTSLFQNQKVKRMVENFMWSRFSYVFNQVLLVTTPTETGARLIRPQLNTNVIAISSGINLEEFNSSGNKDKIKEKYALPDKPVLLYVGRLDPEKRIEEILEAVAVAIKKIDFYFVIVGKGVRKSALEDLAKQLDIEDRVIFTGFVPDEDLPYFYKLSRCFAIASRAELLSLVTLQAMASGLPVIAVDAGALSEIVHDKINGYLFKTGDRDAIVRSLCNIFTKENLYREMAEKSVEYSHQHDIHKTVASFERAYKSCFVKEIITKNSKVPLDLA